MAKFEFKNDTILDIAGHKFEVDSTDLRILKRIDDFAKNSQQYSDDLKQSENFVQGTEKAIKYALDLIEDILGEGACEKIFADEPVSLNKSMQVINYIFDEIGNAKEATLSKYSVNRATKRRTATKKK